MNKLGYDILIIVAFDVGILSVCYALVHATVGFVCILQSWYVARK